MCESRLPIGAAKAIVDGLIGQADEAGLLRSKFEEICEDNLLGGPEIGGKRPKILGRAVVLDAFCARLIKSSRFRTMKQARAWVKRLCKLNVADLKNELANLTLGGYVVWATFREPNRDANPFTPLPAMPEPLHDALALDPKSRGRPLLLFVYSPPDHLVLRFPTVADARWGRLFRPAVEDARCECGLTAPDTDNADIKPVPEVVHETVFGNLVSDVLSILR